jgi:purine nucleoside permease
MTSLLLRLSFLSAFTLLAACAETSGPAADRPIPIKVVVVTMFEIGADSGDRPGEAQFWVERLNLPQTLPFPQGFRDLRYNKDKGVLAVVTGIGTAKSAASVMALGMDPRFDLSRAYWLVAGISGADPHAMSIGSAAWAEWVVDADLSHEIDPREIPADWSTGRIPLRTSRPFPKPVPADNEGTVYHLNAGLAEWAYQLTKDTKLDDTEALQALRRNYVGMPLAQRPPSVIKGDNLDGQTFWHGKLLNDWAEAWVAYWTNGQGQFATSAMEDTGTALSLTFLTKAGRADVNRLMVLRTASNYVMQYPGITAAQSLSGEKKGAYSAYMPALEAAYRVGSRVVNELADHWDRYADRPPSAP